MEEPRFHYSWWFRRRRVRSRCLLVPLRGLPYQVCLGSQLRKWDVGHWTEVGCRERCGQRSVLWFRSDVVQANSVHHGKIQRSTEGGGGHLPESWHFSVCNEQRCGA